MITIRSLCCAMGRPLLSGRRCLLLSIGLLVSAGMVATSVELAAATGDTGVAAGTISATAADSASGGKPAASLRTLLPAIKPEVWQGKWQGQERTLPFTVYYVADIGWGQPEASGRPVAIYLSNLPRPRIGTASDEQIREDLLAQGFVVVDVDASSLPSTTPELEYAVREFHREFQQTMNGVLADNPGAPKLAMADKYARITSSEVFIVPAGYTVSRAVPFWNIEQHGKEGSLQRIVDVHNDHVVKKFKRAEVTDAHDIRNRKGEPLDFNLYLDIVHPALPQQGAEVPLLINFATHSMRMRSFRPEAGSTRMIYPVGLTADGYAWAVVDHVYNPLARHQHFDYFNAYTLEDHNALAVAAASVRHFRANKERYGLNGHVGAMGHSKASYSVVRLLDPAHPQGREHSQFKGFADSSPQEQPYANESSQIDAGFASMGLGTMRTQYLTPQTGPLMTAVGRTDQYGHWKLFPKMAAAVRNLDLNYVDLWMEDLGHDYPYGMDKERGQDRYILFRRFFDQNLKPEIPLEVLYTYPRSGAVGVAADGTSRSLPADDVLPPTMVSSIRRSEPVTVRFARPVDLQTVDGHVYLTRNGDSGKIAGEWKSSLKNTSLQFEPVAPLAADTEYVLHVEPGLRDTNGKTLSVPFSTSFKTAAAP